MSTKIYNGLKLKVDGFDDMLEKFSELRTWVKADTEVRLNQIAAHMRITYIDRTVTGFQREDDTAGKDMSTIYKDIWRRQEDIKKTHRSDPLVDFDFEICVMSAGPGIWLAIPYTDQRDWQKHLQSLPWVEYYGYWDNTDPDEDVSEGDWVRRGLDWDAALGKAGVPALSGLTAQIHDTMLPMLKAEEAIKLIPSFEQRVASRVDDAIAAGAVWYHITNGGDISSYVSSLFTSLKKFKESDEWLSRKDEVQAYVESVLPREITIEHFRGF